MCLLAIYILSLEECLFRSSIHFGLGCSSSCHWVVGDVCIFWKLSPCVGHIVCKYFLLFCRLCFYSVDGFLAYIIYIFKIQSSFPMLPNAAPGVISGVPKHSIKAWILASVLEYIDHGIIEYECSSLLLPAYPHLFKPILSLSWIIKSNSDLCLDWCLPAFSSQFYFSN